MADSLHLGLGVSAWAKGRTRGHVDGIGVYTRSLLTALDALPLSTTLVQFGRCNAQLPADNHDRLCLALPYSAGAAWSTLTPFSHPGSAPLVKRLDVFHAPDHHIPRLGGVPVVATVMDAIPFARPEWVSQRLRGLKNHAFRHLARSAARVITISEFSKADLVHYLGIAPERIRVTPLAVQPGWFERVPEATREAVLQRLGVPAGALLCVGTLQPRKNVSRIIAAHRSLPDSLRAAHPLLVIGQNGWGTETLLTELQALEAEGRGRWLRNVDDTSLLALLQSAQALVYPSLYEGFGLPVLEGFAAGVPVICSNTTSLPEVAGDAALLVEPERLDAIAEAMRRVCEDAALARDLVARGTAQVKRFDWANCARQTVSVYEEVTA